MSPRPNKRRRKRNPSSYVSERRTIVIDVTGHNRNLILQTDAENCMHWTCEWRSLKENTNKRPPPLICRVHNEESLRALTLYILKTRGPSESSRHPTERDWVNGWQNRHEEISRKETLLSATKEQTIGESHDHRRTEGTRHKIMERVNYCMMTARLIYKKGYRLRIWTCGQLEVNVKTNDAEVTRDFHARIKLIQIFNIWISAQSCVLMSEVSRDCLKQWEN